MFHDGMKAASIAEKYISCVSGLCKFFLHCKLIVAHMEHKNILILNMYIYF